MKIRNLDLADIDPIERFDDDRPTRSELADEATHVEPVDFDDVRLAERHGVQADGFFAFENAAKVDDFGMEEPW